LISDLLSPPVIWATLAFPMAFREASSTGQALTWALTYGVLVCLVPVTFIGLMVWRGRITDIHIQVRRQRIIPFVVSLLCTALAWLVLRLMGAPSMFQLLPLFTLIQIAVMLVVTFVWQISMHTMSITGAVVATGALFGPTPALLLSPLIPLVAAARLKLNRHSPAEVIAGVLVGGLVTILLIVIVNPPL
jgi:membrane-associated phospholipid phosphatase